MTSTDVRDEQISFKEYIDSQLDDVRRAAELALQSASGEAVPLRQFFDAVLDEQRRGMVVAEQEREKAAKALRDELARAIEEGDRALRDHILQQVHQIRAALEAAETLELERYSRLQAHVDAVAGTAEQHVGQLRRERELVTAAQQEAIAKAEVSTEKRFESVNEFRAQLNDVIAQFVPREVAETQFAEVRKSVDSITQRFNTMEGSDEGARRARSSISSSATIWLGVLGLLVAVLSVAVIVILANAGQ